MPLITCARLLALIAPCAVLLLPAAARAGDAAAEAETSTLEQNLQVWIGAIDTDDRWDREDPATGEPLDGDLGTVPYFGGGSQRLWGRLGQVGYEGGGLVSWKNDSSTFVGDSNRVRVKIDNTFLSLEVYFGAVLSVRPLPWLRLYAGAGPTLAYAYLDDSEDEREEDGAVVAGSGFSNSGSAVSLTYYGRAGFEFETRNGFRFGAMARYAPHEFDFDDDVELELDTPQYFLTFGQRL